MAAHAQSLFLIAPAMQVQYPCDVSLELTSNQRGWCEQLGVLMDEGTLDATGLGVACAGGALVKIADGKWTDAKTVIENGKVLRAYV